MILDQTSHFELNNGIRMPSIGLGALFTKNEQLVQTVDTALKIGYRKIDTASAYGNESGIGTAIRNSYVAREELFLTTKVWNTEQGYDNTLFAFEKSLEKLQTDYVDMYLIHWPVRSKYKATYKALEKIYESGRAKAIGVCNFSLLQLQELMETTRVIPALHQLEVHPRLSQNTMVEFANMNGIQIEAWRPIMLGEVLNIKTLVQIGKKYNKSAVQISLRWLVQRGISVIPKSVRPEKMLENYQIFDFELTLAEMNCIASLNRNKKLGEDLSHIV